MSQADALLMVIGAQRIDYGVWSGKAWQEERISGLSFPRGEEGLLGALQEVGAELGTMPGMPLRVLVSEAWLPTASVPWNQACVTDAAMRACAADQLRSMAFAVSGSDEIRLDDAPFGQPRVVVAYPAVLLEALARLCRDTRLCLASVLPLGLAGWAYAQHAKAFAGSSSQSRIQGRTQGRILAVLEERHATFVHFGNGRLQQLTSRALQMPVCGGRPATVDAEVLIHWQRMQLRDAQAATIGQLHVLRLDTRESGEGFAEAFAEVAFPDASVPRTLRLAQWASGYRHPLEARSHVQAVSASTRRRLGAAAAVVFAVGAALYAATVSQHVGLLKQQRLRAELDRERSAPRPVALSREEKSRVAAVNAAIRQINLPVGILLKKILPPKDIQVALVAVDLVGETNADSNAGARSGRRLSTLKIAGEARTGADMATYVAFLSGRNPFVAAYLVHHEIVETQREKPYRFTVEAIWQE